MILCNVFDKLTFIIYTSHYVHSEKAIGKGVISAEEEIKKNNKNYVR